LRRSDPDRVCGFIELPAEIREILPGLYDCCTGGDCYAADCCAHGQCFDVDPSELAGGFLD
jgi:hypothetical protein